jgi:hypothetical protein
MSRSLATALRRALCHAQIVLWRIGAAWPVAGVLAGLACTLLFALLEPGWKAQVAKQAQWRVIAARARAAALSASAPSASAPSAAARAASAGNEPHDATALIRRMAELAQAEQIALQQAEYRRQAVAGTGLAQVLVTQPVRAGYPALRRYVEAVLREMPQVSLDQVAVRRESAGQAQLEARLQWSVWLGPVQERPGTEGALVPRGKLIAAAHASEDGQPRPDLFVTRNWTPPPPPPPPAPPPTAPTAPPLPYAFLGKKQEGDQWEVYLARGEQTFVARAGDTLEAQWRIDAIAPPSLTFTYVPLGQAQQLSIGEAR